MTNKLYEALRLVAELLLPGLATLYCALSAVWGWAYAGEVAQTVAAVDVFLGLLVRYLRKRYNYTADSLTDEEGDA